MEDLCMLDSTDWSGRTTTEKVRVLLHGKCSIEAP